MIIQCEKCSTRFRFDDELMEKEGVWLRCGHCKHEFFQKNPSLKEGDILKRSDDSPKTSQERGLDTITSSNSSAERKDKSADVSEKSATREKTAVSHSQGGSGKKIIKIFLKIFLFFILICIFVAVCLLSYMKISGIEIQDIASTVPYMDKIIATEDPSVLKLTQIKIAHLKQQYVKNWTLGDVLVVEGTAWNSTSFPVARIMVTATLCDANGIELARKEAFAGNILTSVELATLPEEAMERELALIHGRDASNDRIESHGNIPFMIVFTKHYPGAAKTKIHVAGMEKLLAN